jgi:hypothetical protein
MNLNTDQPLLYYAFKEYLGFLTGLGVLSMLAVHSDLRIEIGLLSLSLCGFLKELLGIVVLIKSLLPG